MGAEQAYITENGIVLVLLLLKITSSLRCAHNETCYIIITTIVVISVIFEI